MKGDFSRQTFARKNHYSSVRMQQGRVQLDADWNEQADIVSHRERITTRDIIGGCGGPLHDAAFAVKVPPRRPSIIETGERTGGASAADSERRVIDPSGVRVIDPSGIAPIRIPRRPNVGDDFTLGAGRYYVDGILCENEREVRYSEQPDFPEATKFGTAPFNEEALYLLYLDVWQRHLTALDDPHIRETALGGPDTATRTKTIWQAKLWKVPDAKSTVCPEVFGAFMKTEAGRNKGLLNASSVPEDPGSNPCIVPPSAGYRGLENLLYRVEVHKSGPAADVTTNAGSLAVSSFNTSARNQLTLNAGTLPRLGDAVELYPSRAGSDPLAGRLYFVTNVTDRTLTLNQDIQGLELSQQPRLRVALATFKWSRQNGSVVTKIETISTTDNKQVTVQSLGPDDELGFSDGDLVELTDDLTELYGEPGQLTHIVTADNATRTVVLKDAPTVLTSRNAKMRRWDGLGPVRTNPDDSDKNWIALENGLRIQFTPAGADGTNPGVYATGDYWLVPTRTATADRESGQIEWLLDKPVEQGGVPLPQPPEGIEHRYCPLALLEWSKRDGVLVVHDCRRFFPPVTELTTLHYVSGTGQEATPVLPPAPQSLVELLHPLVVGVSNGGVPVEGARVVFEIVEGELNPAAPSGPSDFTHGRLSEVPGGNAVVFSPTKIEVRTDDKGLASCKWELSPVRWNQQVVARLLGPDLKTPIHLPVRFNANLSIASEVAYEPGKCDKLDGVKTVQEALDKLCSLLGLSNEPGVHVTDVTAGSSRLGEVRPNPNLRPSGNIDNDFDLTCDALAQGLTITCDREIFPGSIKGKPTCFVTLELPFPSGTSDKEAWGLKSNEPNFFGYQPVVLDADPSADGQIIFWRPSDFAGKWLRDNLSNLLARFDSRTASSQRPGRVLARLTLKGNFIWSSRDATLYLDGELFGVAEKDSAVTAARAPSGDGKRGGDLELWFWLVQFGLGLENNEVRIDGETAGLVELSGPAPRDGATVQLAVSDPAIASLGSRSITLKAGETQGSFKVRGLKAGQVEIRASYAGGVRRATLSVASLPPPRVEVVRILRSRASTERVVLAERNPTTGFPTDRTLSASQTQLPNAIEVKFTDNVPVPAAGINAQNFMVQSRATGAIIAGTFQAGAGPNTVLWRHENTLPVGLYDVTLVGDGNNAIVSTTKKRLDGDPIQLPSGNGQEGGNFRFVLQVQGGRVINPNA